jgi:hypothetical protein
MLSMHLMVAVSEKARSEPGWLSRPLLDDAILQAAYCLDAPDTVQDGAEWHDDPEWSDCCGPVPRIISVRG